MTGGNPDPDRIQTRDDLARELTSLRTEAGLTVRDLARQVGSPVATLGDYFAGRHVPGTRQVPLFRAILEACEVEDSALADRWVAALTRVRLATDGRAAKGRVPYRGLDAFREVDTDLYFGRRQTVEELLGCLRAARDGPFPGGGAVAVVGPSGSGKTSLLMAGLLPAVRSGGLDDGAAGWTVAAVVPDQLVAGARAALPEEAGAPSLVVVDQLEAALVLPREQRTEVLDAIETLCRTSLVVLGLRADFYHAAVSEPALLPALRNQVILAPMTSSELRDAIVGPVRAVGAGIDEGLVDLILADLAPGSPYGFAHELGALPLLSYALLATWERATRNQLTIADYRAVGGLRGAVRQAAEELYGDLTGPEQDQARRMFGRLVRLEDDGPPTRRRASREELLTGTGAADDDAAAVLERFIAARLLTADAQTIQISHEALLDAWPRLGEWVGSNREWLRVHHQVADAARAWDDSGRDESLLWSGARLETATELAAGTGRDRDLNRGEEEFLSASSAHRQEQERARRRRTRRTHQLLAVIAALAIAASVLAGIAVNARARADLERNQALSRQVAVEAQQLQPTDPSLAAQLALAAYRISPTVQARSTLVDTTASEVPTRLLGPVGPETVSVSGSGRLLAVAQSAADTVALYRLSSGRPVKVGQIAVGRRSAEDYAVAVSADGRLLAAGTTTGVVSIWDVANPGRPTRLASLGKLAGTVYSLVFSPGGHLLAAGTADGTVHQWGLTDPRHPSAQPVLDVPEKSAVRAVAYSKDGTWLAAAGDSGTLDVWRAGDPVPIVAPGTGRTEFSSVAFDPVGTELAVGSATNHTIEAWDLTGTGSLALAHGPLDVATSEVDSVAFSPDGSLLAESSADGTLALYDTGTWTQVAKFGAPDPVTSVAFTPGGHHLVSADSGGATDIWPLPAPGSYVEPGNVYTLDYGSRGRYLVDSSAGANGGVTVWDDSNPLRPTRLADVALPTGFGAVGGVVATSPNGRLMAVANYTAQIQLFDASDIGHPIPVGTLLHGNKPYIEQLSFSPDGKLLLAGDDSGQVRVWDMSDPTDPHPLPTVEGAKGEILGFAFTPDGRILATASSDKKVRIYNIADPEHVRLLATLGGFASYAYDTTITPDGRTLIAGSADGTIRMWDIADPSHPRLLGPPLSIKVGEVFQLAVSPDGHTLAAASTAHAVWLWDIADPSHPQLLDTLAAAKDEVFTVRFDPAGHVMAASGSDNTVHFWDYQPGVAARMVCMTAGDPITRAEWAHYVQGASYRPPCR